MVGQYLRETWTMNERIKELAEKAGAETWSRAPMRAVTGLAFTDENLKKFAELIVKECMDTIAESREARHTAYYYRNRVAEHFGVEE